MEYIRSDCELVYNCFIKCQVCGSITRIRLQVGWQEEHPIVVACRKCGISLNGKVKIRQDMLKIEFNFENAEILEGKESADYIVECSGEFPSKKLNIDEGEFEISPFIRNQARMQENNGYEKFTKSVSRLMQTAQNWPKYKRILDLAQIGNKEYLIQEVKKFIPEKLAPGKNELEILRAVHLVEIIGFITPLRSDVVSDSVISDSILKLDFKQIKDLISYLNSYEGYKLNDLQSIIYKTMNEFIEIYQYLIPVFAIQFYKGDSIDYTEEGSTTSSFDLVKQFYLDVYEALGNLLILPVALNNIKFRGDFKKVKSGLEIRADSLDDFFKLSKASRYHLCDITEIYTEYLRVIVNSKLRNAIGHNDVKYDAISQQITYIPDAKNRSKSRTEYLLEFENEALHLFQAILVIAEYLYKVKEFELIDKGHRPVTSNISSKKIKIGRNDVCPCGSGKKFKKCCMGRGLYD